MSPSMVVHLSLSHPFEIKGKTQFPQLSVIVVVSIFFVVSMIFVVSILVVSVVLSAESVFPVNASCSWISSKASAILSLASSNTSSRAVRESNSSVEQMIEGAEVIWSERTEIAGLEGKLRANSVSLRVTMTTSEQSETSDLPVLRELVKACTAL